MYETNMTDSVFFGLLVAAFITAVHCGGYCSIALDYIDTETKWCEYGCCSESYGTDCCSDEIRIDVLLLFGCIHISAIIVSLIVCLICCRRTLARRGQVIGGSTTVSMPPTSLGASSYSVTIQMTYPQTGYPAGYPQPPVGPYPTPTPTQSTAGDQLYAQTFAQPSLYANVQPK